MTRSAGKPHLDHVSARYGADRTAVFASFRILPRIATLLLLALLLTVAGACRDTDAEPIAVEGGDPDRGEAAIQAYGCGSCHTIPGVEGADGRVAPSLNVWANRAFVAGVMPNDPENVIRFIQDPQDANPLTAMPDLDVAEQDARDITAYLFTLQ